MKLLHWTTLEPQGPSNLAAIRFSSPVNIKVLRIFKPGESLFQEADVLSETQYPEGLEDVIVAMRAFFTAPSLNQDKPRPSNQLAHVKLYYDGETSDFDIETGATRLFVLETSLPRVTLALYGNTGTSSQHNLESSTSTISNVVDISPLPRYLDIANATTPTGLASSLCHECVGKVSMLHILRLMFLLKPSDDDWSIGGYPARYADIPDLPQLEQEPMDDEETVHPKQRWLEEIINELRFPIHDEETPETINLLTEPLSIALNTPNDIKPAWLTHILCNINKHPPKVARVALERIDFVELIRTDLKRDRDLTEKLIICAANPSLCEHLRKPNVMESLFSMKEDRDLDAGSLIDGLITRIQGWVLLKEALRSEESDFLALIPWIADMIGDEESYAMFIQGLAAYDSISALIKTSTEPGTVYPLFTTTTMSRISLADRRAFMRGLVGLGTVLPIFCWANSEGNHRTLQRIIHAFSIWQGHPGYADILNRLLTLKQCIWRLSMTVKDCTQGTSIGAERLLYGLYRSDPTIFFRPAFIEYLSTRSNGWLPVFGDTWYAKSVTEPQPGWEVALRILLSPPFISTDAEECNAAYLLRINADFLRQKIEGGSMELILRTLLDLKAGLYGITASLIEHLSSAVDVLLKCTSSHRISQHRLAEDLLRASYSLLHLMPQFGKIFPPLPRSVDQLSRTMVVLLVISNDLQSTARATGFPIAALARDVDHKHQETIKAFSRDQFGSMASCRLLESLLLQSQYPLKVDLASEIQRTGFIFDSLLPDPVSHDAKEWCRLWASRIVAQLPSFQQFLRRNPPASRVKWITRLVDMDQGEFDLAPSLISAELSLLNVLLQVMQERERNTPLDYALQFQISSILEGIKLLLEWNRQLVSSILFSGNPLEQIATAFTKMSNLRIYDESCVPLAQELLQSKNNQIRLSAVCILLRQYRAREDLCLPDLISTIKGRIGFTRGELETLVAEMGAALRSVSGRESISKQDAHAVVEWLEWLSSTRKNIFIPTLTYDSFQALHRTVEGVLGAPNSNLEAIGRELRFADDELMDDNSHDVVMIMQLGMTPNQILSLLTMQDQPPTPPRLITHPALGLAATSPPSIHRSPISATLTRTYFNNDFRQPRASGAHTNTSRPPSVHIDDFINAGSPLETQSVTSQVSTQNSPAIPQVASNSFIPGL
ncbi:hypothetical protein FRC15_005400 [Serendipita sp. 397]|nr:hypothetical protein FRC15_005400 [Serendipita sp. 397]